MDDNLKQVSETQPEEVIQLGEKPKEENHDFISKNFTPLSILAAAVIIALALIFTHSSPTPASDASKNKADVQAYQGLNFGQNPSQNPTQPAVDIKNIKTEGEPYLGNVNAPVTLAYYSDFQCPFCKQFEQTTMQSMVTDYVNNGKVKIVFKDFQFLGPDSVTAGLYGRAVWDLYPDKYFTWRESMYQNQDSENSGFGDEPSIIALIKTIPGLDANKISQAVSNNKAKYQQEIDADNQEGVKNGIQGTPGFITGTDFIPGALPYDNFKQIIDSQLSATN